MNLRSSTLDRFQTTKVFEELCRRENQPINIVNGRNDRSNCCLAVGLLNL